MRSNLTLKIIHLARVLCDIEPPEPILPLFATAHPAHRVCRLCVALLPFIEGCRHRRNVHNVLHEPNGVKREKLGVHE